LLIRRRTNGKALVLDSVSSPITRRVYNLGLDEFFAWYGQAASGDLVVDPLVEVKAQFFIQLSFHLEAA
jgi:hypothetical protein